MSFTCSLELLECRTQQASVKRLEKWKLNETQQAFQDTTQKKAGSMHRLDRKMTTLTDSDLTER